MKSSNSTDPADAQRPADNLSQFVVPVQVLCHGWVTVPATSSAHAQELVDRGDWDEIDSSGDVIRVSVDYAEPVEQEKGKEAV